MDENCIFCGIASDQIPAYKVYDDGVVIAFLDINPMVSGHVLLTTKEHYPIFQAIPQEALKNLSTAMKIISNAMLKGMKASGTNVFVANGTAAGQKASHFIIHIIPRYPSDGQLALFVPESTGNDEELAKIQTIFIEKLKGMQHKPHVAESNLEKELTKKFDG